MTTTCFACHAETVRAINAPHYNGTEVVRVDACSDCYNAGACVKAPRAPRRPRVQAEVRFDAGGLAAMAGFGSKRNATQIGRRRS